MGTSVTLGSTGLLQWSLNQALKQESAAFESPLKQRGLIQLWALHFFLLCAL